MNQSKKILVVEDEASHQKPVAQKLAAAGYEVDTANNGEEGLIKARAEHPDLILADIVMPKMDGLTMVEKIRSDQSINTIPVIILTNLESARSDARDLSVTDYLVKSSWTLDELVAKVREVLG